MKKLFRVILTACGTLSCVPAAMAEDFFAPAKKGMVMCMKLDPTGPCIAYEKTTLKDGKMIVTSESVFSFQPVVTFTMTATHDEDKVTNCVSGDPEDLDTVRFFKDGAPLSDAEGSMFANELRNRFKPLMGKLACWVEIQTDKGPAYDLQVDDISLGAPPSYISWHAPDALPFLYNDTPSVLFKQ
jgi:hypothetical protein